MPLCQALIASVAHEHVQLCKIGKMIGQDTSQAAMVTKACLNKLNAAVIECNHGDHTALLTHASKLLHGAQQLSSVLQVAVLLQLPQQMTNCARNTICSKPCTA